MDRVLSFIYFIVLVNLHPLNSQSQSYVVQLEENVERTSFGERIFLRNNSIKCISENSNIYLLNLLPEQMTVVLENYRVLNYEVSTPVISRKTPNDFYYSDQWSMSKISAPEAWDITTGGNTATGREIVIAIVDKGFDTDHPDIESNIWTNTHEIPGDLIDNDGNGYTDDFRGYNIFSQNDEHDPHYHGTAVAGLIGSVGNNENGTTGVNWSIKILPVSKGGPGGLFTADIYEMYEYVIKQRQLYNQTDGLEGAYIVSVNASLGVQGAHPDSFPIWCNYMDRLGELGIIYVGSTTNENWDVDTQYDMPISCISPYIIGVTNSDQNDQKPFDAGYGIKSIDLAAPGENTFSIRPNNQYGSFSGTSASSPHVSGAIGLIYSFPCENFDNYVLNNPQAGALLVKKILLEGVDQIPNLKDFSSSGGRLNVHKSLLLLENEFCSETNDHNALKILSLRPSVTSSQMFVEYEKPLGTKAELFILNGLGKVLEIINLDITEPSLKLLELNELILSSGTYFISIRSDREIVTKRFVFIQR